MATIGKLVVSLAANSAKLVSELTKSKKSVNKWAGDVTKSLKSLTKVGAAVGAALSAAIVVAVNKGAAEIDKLAKTASKLGESVAGIQKLNYAFELTGVSADTGNMALQRMVRRVAEAANGTGEAVKALQELNLSAVELNRLAPSDQFYAIAEAMQSVTNQGDRVRLAMKLFDSEGVALVNTMAADLNMLSVEFDALGLSITDNQAKMVEAYQDSKTKLSALFGGFGQVLTTELAGPFTYLVEWVSSSVQEMGGMRKAAQATAKLVISAVKGVATFVGYIAKAFIRIDLYLEKTKLKLLQLKNLYLDLNPHLKFFADKADAATLAASSLNIDRLEAELQKNIPIIEQKMADFFDGLSGSVGQSTNLNDVVTNMIADGLSGDLKAEFLKSKELENAATKAATSSTVNLTNSAQAAADTLKKVSESKAWQDIFGAEDVTARASEFDKYAKLVKDNITSGSSYTQSNLATLKDILQTSINNGAYGFSNNNLFEKLDTQGMAEVIKGLEAMMSEQRNAAPQIQNQVAELIRHGETSQSNLDKVLQLQQNQKPLGKLEIDMTTDTGRVAGEIWGEPEFMARLQDFITRYNRETARAVARG